MPPVESTRGGERILVQYFRKSPGIGSHWAVKVTCSSLGIAQDTDELGHGHLLMPGAGETCQTPHTEIESLGGVVPKGN